jgi:hypothetical protein
MEDMAPKEIAKHLEALAVRLEGSEQITSGVGGSLIVGVGTPQMRLESGGAIALTDCALHFFRTSWRGGTHETVPTSRITGTEVAVGRFADGERPMILLELDDPSGPWAILTTDEQHAFLSGELAAVTE